MPGIKVPTYERQTRFVSAYRGPTASPQAFGSDIGKGLTALGAGVTDVGLAQMQRQAQRQEAEDLNDRQTIKLGVNEDIYKDLVTNRDAQTLSTADATEQAQARWRKMAEGRMQALMDAGHKPSRKARDAIQRDIDGMISEYGLQHVEKVDQGRRLDIVNGANVNIQKIQQSAAEHGNFGATNAEQNAALEALRATLPPAEYAEVEATAREGMGKAVVQHLIRIQDQALLAKDHTEREKVHGQADALIDEAVALGYIDGAGADKFKQVWHDTFDKRASGAMDARARNEALGGARAVNDASAYSYLFGKLADYQEDSHVTGFRPDFATNVAKLFQSAPPEIKAGLGIFSGTRTYAKQAELYKDFLDEKRRGLNPKPVAPPGKSQHNKGNAADLSFNGKRLDHAPPEVIKWVHDNAATLGLSFPVAGEAWHIEGPRREGDAAAGGGEMIKLDTTGGINFADLPAGMRNNNPGNIKFFSGAEGTYQGVVGASENTDQGDRQIVFNSPEAGMAAMAGLVLKKYNAGRTTLTQLIGADGGWTPDSAIPEEARGKAAEAIALRLGIGVDDPINLADDDKLREFMRALMQQEHGDASAQYSDQQVLAGITAARTGQPVVESGETFSGIYGPQGNSFDRMAADTRREIIEGAQAEMARGNDTLKGDIADYNAWLRAGNAPDGRYSPEELSYRLGDILGPEVSQELAASAAYGREVASLAMATPEQEQAVLAQRQAALATPEGYRQDVVDAQGVQAILDAKHKAMNDDPGGYVLDKDQSTRAQYQAMLSLPRTATEAERTAAAHSFAIASLKAQDTLGIAKANQLILSDKGVEAMVAQFTHQPSGGQNAAALIGGWEKQWGQHWEQVFEQLVDDGKLPGTALVVAVMSRDTQQVARDQLAQAAITGDETLEKTVSTTDLREINDSLDGALEDFRDSLSSNGEAGDKTYVQFKAAVRQLAIVYRRQGDGDGATAVNRAVADVLGKAYNFKDQGNARGYRVPIELDADLVDRGAEIARLALGDGTTPLRAPTSYTLDEAQTQEAYARTVSETGYWVTSTTEDGLTLYDQTRSIVRRADGSPVTLTWEQLAADGTNMTYPAIVNRSGQLRTTAETEAAPGPGVTEGSVPVPDVPGPPSAAEAGVPSNVPPGSVAVGNPAEVRVLPSETRVAGERISQAQRRMLVQGISQEQTSRLARSGGDWKSIVTALAQTDNPTEPDIAGVIRQLEILIPGNSDAKQELIENVRKAGQALVKEIATTR